MFFFRVIDKVVNMRSLGHVYQTLLNHNEYRVFRIEKLKLLCIVKAKTCS
jgi:hypothetical protein